ncbi:MAG: hypothetical protein C0501_22115 [Isosphaera sp.]|nr:hypothetical protein [Isosphaera sp.]
MRRILLATAFAALAVAVASPASAGYLVIRVILDGGADRPGIGDPGPFGPFGPADGGRGDDGPGGLGRGGRGGAGAVSGGLVPPPAVAPPDVRNPPNVPPGGTPAPPTHDPTRSIVVVLPVTEDLTKQHPFDPANKWHPASNPYRGPQIHLTHRGEKFVTNLFADNTSVQWYETLKATPGFKQTHATDLKVRYEAWVRAAKAAAKADPPGKADPRGAFDLTVDALRMGLADDALLYADETLAAAAGRKDLPPELAGFVRAYGAVQKAVKGPAAKRASVDGWRARLEAQRVDPSLHYVLLSWDATDDEVRRRLDLLEENFKAFFLTHAVRGVEVRPPEAPLVAVLAKEGRQAVGLARALDGPPRLPADGFYSSEHDLLVLSPERLDSLGQSFTAQVQQIYRDGVSRKDLLAGKAPKVDANGNNGLRRPDDAARLQTFALVDRMAEEAATVAAVSREGTLQLLYATRQLPRFVSLPVWLTDGTANTFARPRDPAFTTDADGKWWVTVSTGPGYGGPNYVQQKYFRDLLAKKELDPDRAALLRNVLTDAYFLGLRERIVLDPDPVPADKAVAGADPVAPPKGPLGRPGELGPDGRPLDPGAQPGAGPLTVVDFAALQRKKRERLEVKAHATAWALCYYLSRDKPADLARFTAELAAFPRDLPLDGATLTAAFCRSFGLDGSPKSLKGFADGWLEYMNVAQVGHDIPLADPKPPMPVDPANPVPMPVNPGGRPGGRPGGGS